MHQRLTRLCARGPRPCLETMRHKWVEMFGIHKQTLLDQSYALVGSTQNGYF